MKCILQDYKSEVDPSYPFIFTKVFYRNKKYDQCFFLQPGNASEIVNTSRPNPV